MKRVLSVVVALVLLMLLSVPAHAAGFPIAYESLDDEDKPFYGILEAHIDDLKRDKEVFAYYEKDSNRKTKAKVAFEYDHPEIFWAETLSLSSDLEDVRAKRTVFRIENYCYGPDGNRDLAADEAFLQSKVQEICAEAREAGSSRYDQLLYIHDWLTTHNRYNTAATEEANEKQDEYLEEFKSHMDRTPWNALSALSDDTEPVCEGYSYAFKLLCDELGIPCAYVTGDTNGGGHAWNYVMMEDGNWYGVDVTWDDISIDGIYDDWSGYENHDYFLKGRASFFQNDRQEATLNSIYPEPPKICEADYVPGAYTGEPVPYTAPAIDMSIAYNQTAPTPTPAPTPMPVVTPVPTPSPTPVPMDSGADKVLGWILGYPRMRAIRDSGTSSEAILFGAAAAVLLIILILVIRSRRRRR